MLDGVVPANTKSIVFFLTQVPAPLPDGFVASLYVSCVLPSFSPRCPVVVALPPQS